jgi:glycosyltransferase involved in cell wall biosynthesis
MRFLSLASASRATYNPSVSQLPMERHLSPKASRPRLLVMTPAFPYPLASGGDIRVFHFLKTLALRFDVHLLCFGTGSADALIRETNIAAVHTVASTTAPPASIRERVIRRLNFWRDAPHGFNLDINGGYASVLRNLITQVSFDGVVIDHLYMMQYARFVKGLPIFYSATDVETIKFARWYENASLSRKRRLLLAAQISAVKRAESGVGRVARITFATSVPDKVALERLNRHGTFLVAPNGVDLDFFRSRRRDTFDGAPAIFFVGTMFYKPNLDAATLLAREIVPRIRAEIPEAVCHIAGKQSNAEGGELHDPARGVVMHGFVDDVRPYLQRCQALVVPLLAGSGTRIKILEAMGSGTPVVSTSIGAEGIEYTDGLNILIADTPSDIASAAVGLLRERERAFDIGAAGRRLVEEKYSWNASARILSDAIEETLALA